LPKTETEWAVSARVKWLQTAANVFDLIYKGDGGIKIEMAWRNDHRALVINDEVAN
jgi:hypothetical protein